MACSDARSRSLKLSEARQKDLPQKNIYFSFMPKDEGLSATKGVRRRSTAMVTDSCCLYSVPFHVLPPDEDPGMAPGLLLQSTWLEDVCCAFSRLAPAGLFLPIAAA
jgi:hypothetical protein